jgi:hypothetical protein
LFNFVPSLGSANDLNNLEVQFGAVTLTFASGNSRDRKPPNALRGAVMARGFKQQDTKRGAALPREEVSFSGISMCNV